ncbi:hypothetical protein RCL_jg28815.t1 [Rhizophagus clarus]|uniref:Uncharacterized protein n=1 Tax=Rhizophagus clarus TaxID=94130 RepID=A0A8H3LPJ7_9GLOM|nr:hypothetical protein RCL_jg28815.t1 [Rhizophagus clarus]
MTRFYNSFLIWTGRSEDLKQISDQSYQGVKLTKNQKIRPAHKGSLELSDYVSIVKIVMETGSYTEHLNSNLKRLLYTQGYQDHFLFEEFKYQWIWINKIGETKISIRNLCLLKMPVSYVRYIRPTAVRNVLERKKKVKRENETRGYRKEENKRREQKETD